MQALTLPQLRPFAKWAPLVLRLGVGITMAAHGYSKLQAGASGWLGGGMLVNNVGFPEGVAVPVAWLVLIVELVGGLFIVFGLLTRISAILIAIVMLVAIFTVKLEKGFLGGWELDWMILTSAITLILTGSGELGLDRLLGWDSES